MNKATLLPISESDVLWVRYTGDNLDEVKEWCNKLHPDKRIFIDTGTSQTLYWEGEGMIHRGDFVVEGYVLGNSGKRVHVINWKEFPRMVKEDIPVFLDEYRNQYTENNKENE